MSINPTLSLSTILNVSVIVSPVGSPGPSFNQALIIGPSTTIPSVGSNSRLRQYTSTTSMLTDGFSPTSPEFLSATMYFGQSPAPTYLWIGRQDLTAIETISIGTPAGNGYVVGDIVTILQSGAQGGQAKILTVNAGVPTSVALVSGFRGTGYSVASNLATSGGTGTGLEISITGIGETPLQAVTACRLASPTWYAMAFMGTASDADIIAMAGYIESCSPPSMYFVNSGEAAILNNTAGNVFATLQGSAYRRTVMLYATTQGGVYPNQTYAAAAPMGVMMGRNTGGAGSYFNLMFKPIAGLVPEPLTQTQVNVLAGSADRSAPGLNVNVFVAFANGAYSWIQNGTVASGAFIDQTLFLDMLASQIQINGINLLISVPSLPITNDGVSHMANVVTQACVQSQAIGFIAPSGVWNGQTVGSGTNQITAGTAFPKGYYVYAPSVTTLTQAQRAARQLPPITVMLIEAQSGQSLSVTVNVQQ